jgi:hypothetical protein
MTLYRVVLFIHLMTASNILTIAHIRRTRLRMCSRKISQIQEG